MTEYLEEIAVCPQEELASKKESRFAVRWRERDKLQHPMAAAPTDRGELDQEPGWV